MAEKELRIKVITEADTGDLENAEDALGNLQSKADETGEALRTAFEEAQTEVEELETALNDAVLEGDTEGAEQIAEQLSEARDRAEELEETLNGIDSGGLDDAASSASDLSDELSNAQGSADELSGSMGLIEGTMMLDLANQAGQIGGTAESMAQGIDNASISVGQLATQTGIAEPQMRNLIAHISNATFPQNEAMAYVTMLNQMGVSSENLGSAATNIDRINDATGMGYTNAMQLVRGFGALGVEGDNLESTFNAVAYAEDNSIGGAKDMGSILKMQAGTLNEYHVGVDAATVAISQLSHQYGSARKAGAALSKSLKDNNGDLRAVEQELGLTEGSLTNATAATSAYDGELMELANQEAEHKTITQQLGAAWEDLSLQMSPIMAPLMSFLGLIGQFGQIALAVNSIITLAQTFGILEATEGSLIPVQIAEGVAGNFSISWIIIAIALGIALGLALVYLYNHSERFRNAVQWLGNTLMWLAQTAIAGVQSAINTFRNILQAIPNAIQACLDWARDLIMNHPIVQAIIWLGDKISWAFSALGLGQRSPGKIYKALKLEFDSSEEMVEDSKLPTMFAKLGGSMSDNFNPSLNKIDSSQFANNIIADGMQNNEGNGKTEVNNTFNIDYLAKKEFVQDIIDIIQHEINWDNKTAGRSV